VFTTALAWPLLTSAFSPANVTGINAAFTDGQIGIEWNAPGGDVVTYRVYYSQRSILSNNGAYDDFVQTNSDATSFVMSSVPPYSPVYLSVLAVNTKGEESPSFVEEVQVNTTNGNIALHISPEPVPAHPVPQAPPAPVSSLPQSGLPVAAILLGSGAIAGWKGMKKKKI
jgi:hypothetical protein